MDDLDVEVAVEVVVAVAEEMEDAQTGVVHRPETLTHLLIGAGKKCTQALRTSRLIMI